MSEAAGLTSQTAEAELAQLHGDKRTFEILNDKSHPEYQQLVARRDALARAAYPEEVLADSVTLAAQEALARPRSSEEYTIEIESLPREYAGDDDRATAAGLARVREWFHAAGMSAAEARNVMARFAEVGCDPKRNDPAVDSARAAKCAATLRTLWGAAYEAELAAAARAVHRLGGAQLARVLEVTRLGNDPWVIRTLADTSKRNRW
ncbi:MAG: hypothetical protein U1F33_07060 [Alphaproteobacteria bacterium]